MIDDETTVRLFIIIILVEDLNPFTGNRFNSFNVLFASKNLNLFSVSHFSIY